MPSTPTKIRVATLAAWTYLCWLFWDDWLLLLLNHSFLVAWVIISFAWALLMDKSAAPPMKPRNNAFEGDD